MIISNLSKKFGKKIIFDKFDLTIAEKGVTVLSGNSGCGKTTLLRMIAGLDKKYSGKIDHGHIKRISYVFQEPRLLPNCTALENVSLVLGNNENAKLTATEWLTKVGLENDLNTYPDELSGGMKQRVAIARAFAYDGDILLLDEAFNGIDAERAKSIIFDMIAPFAKYKPCIIVTHTPELLTGLDYTLIEL